MSNTFSLVARPLGLATLIVFSAGAADAAQLSGNALIQALRQGGYVLVMRHTSSPAAIPDKAAANPDNTRPERQLDETGRTTARAMGEAVRTLRLPLAEVFSSPTYRAEETVRYAGFGPPTTYPELGDGGLGMLSPAEPQRAFWLRAKAAEAPRAGQDVLVVTHAPNIIGAFGTTVSDIADGEALVFHPDGKGGAEMVARVKIGDWPILAR